MSSRPGLLARGPWRPDQVEAVWREDPYEVPASVERLADGAVEDLRERGSPAHDGMATRLAAWEAGGDRLRLELPLLVKLAREGLGRALTEVHRSSGAARPAVCPG